MRAGVGMVSMGDAGMSQLFSCRWNRWWIPCAPWIPPAPLPPLAGRTGVPLSSRDTPPSGRGSGSMGVSVAYPDSAHGARP